MTDTTDDPMQDPTVLASAYLDGEVTPAERALVESDPSVLAEVDELRRVRALVAADADEPGSVSVREAQLAAALDVFDQVVPSAAVGAVTPMSSGRARRARRRDGGRSSDRLRLVLGTAAGLVILAGAGAVINGVITGADDDATEDLADAAVADEPAEEIGPAEADIAAEVAGENTNDELPGVVDETEVARDVADDEAPAAASVAEEPAELVDAPASDAPAEEATPESDTVGAVDDTDDLPTAEDPPPEVDLVELRTPQDLADFAAPAAFAETNDVMFEDGAGDASTIPCSATPPRGLGIDRLAEPALVGGLVIDVGIDLDLGVAYAFDVTCSIILRAELPSADEFLAGDATTPVTTTP